MKIPVLMYHALVADTDTGSHRVHVMITEFCRQMQWLSENGYASVGLEALSAKASLPRQFLENPALKPVLITFDDGYHSLYSQAMPVLAEHDFKAVLFLTTDPVGQEGYGLAPGLAASAPSGDRPLRWSELREMRDRGWQIESHSRTHPNHASLNLGQLESEINGSREVIENALGKTMQSYAVPYGFYSAKTLAMLENSGFKTCFSVHPGLASPGRKLLSIPRLSIERQTNLSTFEKQVTTGYVSGGQQAKSKLRDLLFSSSFLKDLISPAKNKIPG